MCGLWVSYLCGYGYVLIAWFIGIGYVFTVGTGGTSVCISRVLSWICGCVSRVYVLALNLFWPCVCVGHEHVLANDMCRS